MALSPRLLLTAFLRFSALARADQAEDECEVLLLQTSAGLQRQSVVQPAPEEDLQAAQAARLEAAVPLVWLHVPKTGSSIANAFIRLPGACEDSLEEIGDDSFHTMVEGDESPFQAFGFRSCEGIAAAPLADHGIFGAHIYVGNESIFNEHYDGHGVTMLRQPEQRVISGMRHLADVMETTVDDVQFSAGCATRLLAAGEGHDWDGSDAAAACFGVSPAVNRSSHFGVEPGQEAPSSPPSAAEVASAVARIRRFAFVGIQEEWSLSICLLHALFGGECSAAEFENIRLGVPSNRDGLAVPHADDEPIFEAPEPYDTSILGGWVDEADRAVYAAGLEMFHTMCQEHGVAPETCRPCFQSAGLL